MVGTKNACRTTTTAEQLGDAQVRAMLEPGQELRRLPPSLSGSEKSQPQRKRRVSGTTCLSEVEFPNQLLEYIESLGHLWDGIFSAPTVRKGSLEHRRLFSDPPLHGKVPAYSAHRRPRPPQQDRVPFRGGTS